MNFFLRDDGRLLVIWRFVFAVIAVVLMNFVAGTLGATFGNGDPRIEDVTYRLLLTVLLLGCFFGMASVFDQPDDRIWAYIGFPRKNWLRQTLAGALLGFVLIFLVVIVVALFFQYHIFRIVLSPHTLKLPGLITVTLLAGAMAEELMFRGYPFQRLVDAIGKVGAVLMLSALFGLVHLHNPHVADSRAVRIFAFSNTLLMGVVLAIAYLRTKALWFPLALHFSWNFTLGLIFGLPVSGLGEFSVLLHARARGPAWVLGGGYGPEGGLLGTAVILLALGYVVVFIRPARTEPVVNEGYSSSIQTTGTI